MELDGKEDDGNTLILTLIHLCVAGSWLLTSLEVVAYCSRQTAVPYSLCWYQGAPVLLKIFSRFTCVSLFHYKISLLFFRFFSLICFIFFAWKRNEAPNSSLFFRFFCFVCFFLLFLLYFALNFWLRFDLVIFTSKRNVGENFFASKEAKFNIFAHYFASQFRFGWKKNIFVNFFA